MFGEYLVKKDVISQENLNEALSVKAIARRKIGRILVELDILSQSECDHELTEFLDIKTDENFLPFISDKSRRMAFEILDTNGQLAVLVRGEGVRLYFREFLDVVVEKVEMSENDFSCYLVTADQWKLLVSLSHPTQQKVKNICLLENSLKEKKANSTPYSDLLVNLLEKAMSLNASDIHFDSTLDGLSIRFRVNGDLATVKTIKREHSQAFLTEVKALTGLPLAVIGSPCSGAAKFANLGLKVRAQSNGQIHGETIVLRLINEAKIADASISKIGADQIFEDDLRNALKFSNGIILICGPTGSGKSWTLFSLLMSMDRQTSKVITIEDPVEYEGSGLMQIEMVDGKIGFEEALRSSLRLDPDVIMLGEIRDEKTAELAFKAASTGHLVLSTLHTNGAYEAIERLKGLGIAEDLILSNLRLVSAVTLRKKLCECCRIPLSSPELEAFGDEVEMLAFEGAQFYKRNLQGCSDPKCHEGATGRTILSESIVQNDVQVLQTTTLLPSFRSLKQCALEKASLGIIGIEEVYNG